MHAFLYISLLQHSAVQYPFWHVVCNALLRSPVLLACFLLFHPNWQRMVYLPRVTQPAGWLAHTAFLHHLHTEVCKGRIWVEKEAQLNYGIKNARGNA